MFRLLKPNELIEKGDLSWPYCGWPDNVPNPALNPTEEMKFEFAVNEMAYGMTAQEAANRWSWAEVYTERIKVLRRLEDDEIIQEGDTCGSRREFYNARTMASRFDPIRDTTCFGLTAKQARKLFTNYDFFTSRSEYHPIFNKPFNLLDNVSLVE